MTNAWLGAGAQSKISMGHPGSEAALSLRAAIPSQSLSVSLILLFLSRLVRLLAPRNEWAVEGGRIDWHANTSSP